MSKTSKPLLVTYFINTLGSALTWTGLPIYLAQQSGDIKRTSEFFLISTAASLSMLLVGGIISDRVSVKSAAVTLNCVSALIMCAVTIAAKHHHWLGVSIGMFALFMVSAILEIVENCWFLGLTRSDGMDSAVGSRQSWKAFAKILGFTAGPVFFSALGEKALIIDALSFGIVALIQSRISPVIQKPSLGNTPPIVNVLEGALAIVRLERSSFLIAGGLLCGMLSFPLVNAFLTKLIELSGGSENWVSLFWLIGGLGFTLSGAFFKKVGSQFQNQTRLFAALGILQVLAASTLLAASPVLVLLGFSLMTLVNPVFSMLLNTNVFLLAPNDMKGRFNALSEILFELGVVAGLLANVVVPLFLAAIILRALIFSKWTQGHYYGRPQAP